MALSKKDIEFLKEMIPHHEHALEMVAKLGAGGDSRVKALATGIKKAQEKEIKRMKDLLAPLGETPGKSSGHKH